MPRQNEEWAQPVILGLLTAGPRHGYDLYQEMERDLATVWQIGLSQLYAQLKQLEDAALVTAVTEPQASRPARKVYHVTEEGRAVFLDWLHRPARRFRLMRVEFLLRLYFFDRLALPGRDDLIQAQRSGYGEQAERHARAAAESSGGFPRLVHEFRQGQMEAGIRWLDRCQEILSAPPQAPGEQTQRHG